MILGNVSLRCEAMLPLVVDNANGQQQIIEAVIDTGFNGFLTLPLDIITQLDLSWNGSDTVTLGDGSETLFDIYSARIIWDGQFREIDVAESETEPLIGMGLLYGYKLQIEVVERGLVTIVALA
ncbi:clan AA aspartic protease [Pseudanabaena sp. ABRG5-3]|uniref:clan AA aspartic protease n=1 Tax=Pseudanabaena sp. ABRG5-3 TaxID=685565 RepID=UPI000DC702A3|nr:aspartyl protease [Pseudanabaena sp. ABRG5-3]